MAEYAPILDPEIAPEAPGASILFHKLRDNPEAIAEGATGAPKILTPAINDSAVTTAKIANESVLLSKIAIAIGAGSGGGADYSNRALPGGKYGLTWASALIQTGSGNTTGGLNMTFEHTIAGAGDQTGSFFQAMYSSSANSTFTHEVNYISADPISEFWLWLLNDKTTGEILEKWASCHHPCYGQQNPMKFPQPFLNYDPAIHEINFVYFDKENFERIQIGRVPMIAGGYLTPEILETGLFNIDPFVNQRGILDTIDALYNYNYGISGFWHSDPVVIAPGINIPGLEEPLTAIIPKPIEVNTIGATLI